MFLMSWWCRSGSRGPIRDAGRDCVDLRGQPHDRRVGRHMIVLELSRDHAKIGFSQYPEGRVP